jgi:hypothetical protein
VKETRRYNPGGGAPARTFYEKCMAAQGYDKK